MKNYNVYLILIIVLVYLSSCIESKVFIQKVEVEGPMLQPMAKITSNKNVDEVETSFRLLVNSRDKVKINTNGHTYVNAAGEYEVEDVQNEIYYRENIGANLIQYKGNNTSWNLPELQFGINMDIPLSNSVSFTAGLDYSNINSSSYWSGNFSIGFFKEFENTAWRFDGIVNLTYIKSNVDYIVTRHYYSDDFKYVYFYNKEINDKYTDLKFMITFNTKNIDTPVDLFFNVSFGSQRFFNNNVSAIDENESISLENNPVNFGFGFYKNITPGTRIILGSTINNQTQRNPALTYPVYFLQLDSYLFTGD